MCQLPASGVAQEEFEREPILYGKREATDRVGKLAARLRRGDAKLEWDARHGWLPSLLRQLDVPASSQTLVFSKTSLQFRHIFPSNPRALYFGEDVYIGLVPGGAIIELTAVDPQQGAIFYTLSTRRSGAPEIQRDHGECLSCHVSARTRGVPGFLVRSVYPLADGQPEFRLGTLTTDHTTPFRDRFGGWYVTGSHGSMRHRGNAIATGDSGDPIDREAGANRSRLPDSVRIERYLESGSDIVALMLLEHQTQFHNRVTLASYTARQAMHQQRSMNRVLERPEGFLGENTLRRIHSVAEGLVRYLFFCGEHELSSPVRGSSSFSRDFSRAGRRDSKGRSLRDLDLERRLLVHPCSYLIYSDSFLALPPAVTSRVKSRMLEVLSGSDQSGTFAHLSAADRAGILEILSETHPLFGKRQEEL